MPALDTLLPKALAVSCGKNTSAALWAEVLNPFMWAAGISNQKRIAAFIGQMSIESAGFTKLEEDLNYSARRACEVWPVHFEDDPGLAQSCAYSPERLANVVYANRMGNGDEASGDGWRYRGAGLIQITGKNNHLRFAAAAKIDPATVGDYLRTSKGAAHSACWYWVERSLSSLADGWFITSISRKINGGDEGLKARIAACIAALHAVGG